MTGALVPNTLLGARYRVTQLVGKGGFGAVYQANDERFQGRRRVAVKEMSNAQLGQAEQARALASFRQEADLLVQLKHVNLPDVSDFLEEGGKAYLIMEFVDGATLEKVQQNTKGPLDETQVMGWALQLCEVLDYLHNQPHPVIFRDLKPSNIMVTRTNQIKLIDFGIARVFKSTSAKDTDTLGSQGYAPLEQYGRGQSDARTDIYALGATLYDILTNTVPPPSPMRRLNPQGFLRPRQLNPRLSAGVEQVLLIAMGELPDDRYQSAAEMYQAITNLGFSHTRISGGIRVPTSANTPTMVATQPGSVLSSQAPNTPVPAAGPQPGVPTTPANPYVPGHGPGLGQHSMASPPLSQPGQTGAPFTPPPTPSPTQPPTRFARRTLLIGGASAIVAGAIGVSIFTHLPAATAEISLAFAYSTEKADWLKAALASFNQSNPRLNNKRIRVELTELGSLDGQDQILSGQIKPVAWCPASNLELNRLNYKWQQAHSGQSIISYTTQYQPRSLVKSPLVLASWQQRAQKLLAYYHVPTLDWTTLSTAFQLDSWTEIGGEENWGPVKFGQTLPTQSNSGLLTIVLLAYNYFKATRGLTATQVGDPRYWDYLAIFEKAVNQFGHSSGTYLKNEAIGVGPAQADVIATYENLVLTSQEQAQSQQKQPLLIYYPAVNILSEHPFAVLQGDWATDEEKQAALQLRDFLLGAAQQRLALAYGFRPGDPTISLSSSGKNLFVTQAGLFPNHRPDPLQSQAQPPDGNVIDALITGWSQHYPTPPVTNG
ncbi:MAG TPA: protein kinase [Ktedonobacteraceae bacterium]|nr:protein kinase [Ktedonobacteraceae bacterium]